MKTPTATRRRFLQATAAIAAPAIVPSSVLGLSRTSPGINRGSNRAAPPCDYDGDPRPAMGAVDMGADEFTGAHLLAADAFALSAAAGQRLCEPALWRDRSGAVLFR